MFNPRVVVVGGQSCSSHPGLLDSAIHTARQYARSAGVPEPVVRGARCGLLAAAVGAAAVALHHYLRPLHTAVTVSGTRATGNDPAAVADGNDSNNTLCAETEPP